MDYEKKYNEALKRAKAAIDVAADKELVKGVATTIFPELRESEDEKVMKILSDVFAISGDRFISEYERKLVVPWLEKQKEQKPDSLTKYVYSKEDKKFIQDCANILVANDYATSAERLLSMFEQKPNYCHHEVDETGWTEEYRKAYYDGWNNCNMQHEQLKADHKPAEWSEEDEENIDSLIIILHKALSKGISCKEEVLDLTDWLKSLRPNKQD